MRDDKAWMRPAQPADGPKPSNLDTTVAHSARVNNYWQGGKDNFAADRAAAEQALAAFPGLPVAIRAGPAVAPPGDPVPGHRRRVGAKSFANVCKRTHTRAILG